jgi:hypothetical protein
MSLRSTGVVVVVDQNHKEDTQWTDRSIKYEYY